MADDWFTRLTGFPERDYDDTRASLRVEDDQLVSTVSGARHGVGTLSLPTLAQLRTDTTFPRPQRSTIRCFTGEARSMHADPKLHGALFQVASQFNLLEMTSPYVTPEDGVTRYVDDHTQGPACAVAAGAATIYRNYFAPVGGEIGQTRDRQIDALAHVGDRLSATLDRPVSELWTMRNGYALCTRDGLRAITDLLGRGTEEERDDLRGRLAIGLHRHVQVTDVPEPHLVSQAYCSALPVAYGEGRPAEWEAFARLVLEAAYEATLLAAVGETSNVVLLTRLGGGVFGNADAWIDDAIVRAVDIVADAGLDIRLVSHGRVHDSFRAIEERFR
ncbi:hypothetical protein CIW49_13420 [Mycolicibacterium sp. P1-18]|uniref:hypothetical protein n=1 Tax=Mycolicibacterium sp. P1-18 TaxID=2024615 RepID=UPI0011F1A7E3|nr:hypothetical protein [Mycolicibacterium sp. P1-18]KAA0098874.1 hypothetical protein CIW49_13420 [Mycolicibacterium sp. P1-18]